MQEANSKQDHVVVNQNKILFPHLGNGKEIALILQLGYTSCQALSFQALFFWEP